MGYHLHLIAVREDELRDDAAWLDELFDAAWDAEPAPDTVQMVVQKDFVALDRLVCGEEKHAIGPEEPASLLICGGRPVYHPRHQEGPPYVLLTAAEVRLAGRFVESTDFEELWAAAGDEFEHDPVGREEGEMRAMFRRYYERLRDTYGRAAGEDRAMAKHFSF
ncbi:DUF1877 family protein [Streptomyces carpinensis]|uniref:DUF1877 family protein n=1 Tax=Streptomyces carpinensis TaxID=66369 RepID=A0ABV1VW63_9ACTN|nr:DUF1877 family protein [Streptomyces carpinensis]